MRHFSRQWILGSLFLLLVASPLLGQTVTGTMNGNVSDSSGAALPGVTVSIRNQETGLERVVVTDGSGFFNAPFLPVGLYRVQAELSGLSPQSRQNVRVDLNQTTVQDFVLGMTVTETVVVRADAPRINVTDGEVKQTMRSEEIMSIPQGNQTSFLGLAATFSGYQEQPVQFGSGVSADMSTLSTGSSVMFNGTGTRGTTFQINGVSNDDRSENQHRQGVALATIKSFQILSNSFSAEFGGGYGAVVLVQTKSGTNEISGEAYGYFQDWGWNEKHILEQALPKPDRYRRQYGLTLGFPLRQDTIFGFISLDQIQDEGESIITRAIWLPSDYALPRLTLNNDTPENRAFQDSILSRFPKIAPNATHLHARAHQWAQVQSRPAYDYTGRLDWNISPSNSATARYQRSYSKIDRAVGGEFIPGELVIDNNRQSNLGVTWTAIQSSDTVHEVRYGLGIRRTQNDIAAGNDVPIVRFAGISNGTILGNASAFPIDRSQRDQQLVYNISSSRWGRHTLKAGFDIRRGQLNDRAEDRNRGFWNFGASCLGVAYPTGFHAFMAGCISSFQKSFGPVYLENSIDENNVYVQDDWRPWDNLTLNLGVRYEMVGAPEEDEDRIDYPYDNSNYLDPRLGFAYSPNWDNNRWLRAITGGNGRFAIRGGFGIYHGRVFQSIFSQVGASVRFNPPNGISLAPPATTALADPTGGFVYDPSRPLTTRISLTTIDPDLKMPESRQWNLTFERQMFGSARLRTSYVGTMGKNLLQYSYWNLPVIPGAPGSGATWVFAQDVLCAGTGLPGAPTNAACPTAVPLAANEVSLRFPRTNERRPDQRYGRNLQISNAAESWYHAGELEFETGLRRGFQSRLTYTFSKAIDTGSEATFSGAGDLNIFGPNEKYKRGLSRFDTRHRLTMTASYDLPFLRNQEGFLASALGGWQVSTVIRLTSGTPFTIVDTGAADIDFDDVPNQRPICINPEYCGGWHVNYPNTSQREMPRTAFRRPAFGDDINDLIGRNTYFTDGVEQVDFGLYKSFKLPAGAEALVVRLDILNAFDHTTWGFPTNDLANANFGRITSAFYTPRTIQLGFRLLY